MLQVMDNMKASCIFYVKVGKFDQLQQSKICILTITKWGIFMATVQYGLILSICLM